MKITYLGHAALAIEVGETHIIVDPFISPNELAKDIDINALKADYTRPSGSYCGCGDHRKEYWRQDRI